MTLGLTVIELIEVILLVFVMIFLYYIWRSLAG